MSKPELKKHQAQYILPERILSHKDCIFFSFPHYFVFYIAPQRYLFFFGRATQQDLSFPSRDSTCSGSTKS